jgi:hypothetical protein
MHARSTLTAALAAAALILVAPAVQAAQAATADRFDRSAFDSTPVVTSAGYAMSAPTAGELGGHLDLSVQAADGTIPNQGQCETANVDAVLTLTPGESFAVHTTGELCSHFIDGTPTLDASFGAKQVTYTGTHKRARVGDGIIGFKNSVLGAQGSVGLTVRW